MGVQNIYVVPVCIALFFAFPIASLGKKDPSNVHTVFLVECSMYFQWQSLGMYYSHKKSGQPGPITRVMCCDDMQRAGLESQGVLQDWINIGPTHMAPSYANKNPHNDDHYSAYNKPLAVIDWLEKAEPEEDWLLILDADMTLHLPFVCKGEDNGAGMEPFELDCKRGQPISADYGYLKGSTNELALKHLPDPVKRNDSEGGQPFGRYADQVGGIFFVHKEDMKKYMRDWLTYTEAVRYDPDAWRLSGDEYTKQPGDKPWISEMYGYVFAAAKHNMWHKIDPFAMIYPGNESPMVYRLMHYGLEFKIDWWSFDKHNHYEFDPIACPPWGGRPHARSIKGLFQHPPPVDELISRPDSENRLKDVLAIETINVINEALCHHHETHCPGIFENSEYKRECARVRQIAEEVRQELIRLSKVPKSVKGAICHEEDERCRVWARGGECSKNFGYMSANCYTSCGIHCLPPLPPSQLGPHPIKVELYPPYKEVLKDPSPPPPPPVPISEVLGRECMRQQGLSATQVKDCLLAATKGQKYVQAADGVPEVDSHHEEQPVQVIQAHPAATSYWDYAWFGLAVWLGIVAGVLTVMPRSKRKKAAIRLL